MSLFFTLTLCWMKAAGKGERKKFVSNFISLMTETFSEALTRLGHGFNIVALENELVLLGCRVDARNSLHHLDLTDELLAKEVSDLDHRILLAGNAVDGEVSVYSSHFVFESL